MPNFDSILRTRCIVVVMSSASCDQILPWISSHRSWRNKLRASAFVKDRTTAIREINWSTYSSIVLDPRVEANVLQRLRAGHPSITWAVPWWTVSSWDQANVHKAISANVRQSLLWKQKHTLISCHHKCFQCRKTNQLGKSKIMDCYRWK